MIASNRPAFLSDCLAGVESKMTAKAPAEMPEILHIVLGGLDMRGLVVLSTAKEGRPVAPNRPSGWLRRAAE